VSSRAGRFEPFICNRMNSSKSWSISSSDISRIQLVSRELFNLSLEDLFYAIYNNYIYFWLTLNS